MKRTIYVAKADRTNGDSFNLIVTFDEVEAKKAIAKDLDHLTEREKKYYTHWIDSKEAEIEDGETAIDAYNRLLLEDEWN